MKTEEILEELKESMDKPLKEFLSEYGADAQVDMAIEEMSELTKAFLKWRRSRKKCNASEKNVRKHCGRNCRRKNYVKTDGTPLWMRKPGQGTNGI